MLWQLPDPAAVGWKQPPMMWTPVGGAVCQEIFIYKKRATARFGPWWEFAAPGPIANIYSNITPFPCFVWILFLFLCFSRRIHLWIGFICSFGKYLLGPHPLRKAAQFNSTVMLTEEQFE